MLSSQTKDATTAAAMERLQEHGLTIESINEIDASDLEQLIYPASFYRTKAKNLKRVAQILTDDYNGTCPREYKSVLKLPGVGPKMAILYMKIVSPTQCFEEVHGISVDTHVHRMSNRLGWVNSKTPEQTRHQLEAFLPNDIWGDVNLMLVGYGQTVCRPVHPLCSECPVRHLCPTGLQQRKTKAKKH